MKNEVLRHGCVRDGLLRGGITVGTISSSGISERGGSICQFFDSRKGVSVHVRVGVFTQHVLKPL